MYSVVMRNILVSLLLVAGSSLLVSAQCPVPDEETCECIYEDTLLTEVRCSGIVDPYMPQLVPSLDIISNFVVENSTIGSVQPGTFMGQSVRNLVLRNIGLTLLDADALRGMEDYLETLDLSGNALTFLPDQLLDGFVHLSILSIDGNKLEYLNVAFFASLPSLHYLSISNNRIGLIAPGTFSALPSLSRLYLNNNRLKVIKDKTVSHIPKLAELNLRENNISTLSADVFAQLPNLKWLDLSENNITGIGYELFRDTPQLEVLYLTRNQINVIPSGAFSATGKIRILSLSRNNISDLHESAFQSMRGVENLHLDNNHISTLPVLIFENLEKLQILNLHNNEILALPYNNFVGLSSLVELDLHGNLIETLTYGIFDPLGLLKRVDLSSNLINMVHEGPFDALRHLVSLNMRDNELTRVESHWFKKAADMNELDLGRNKIRVIETNAFWYMPNLEILTLDYNYLTELEPGLLANNLALKTVSFAHNPLYGVPKSLFGMQRNLTTLQLNLTCITDLPNGMYANQTNLKELYFDHTPLTSIHQYSFFGLGKLEVLRLGYNNISQIESRAFSFPTMLRVLSYVHNSLTNMEFDDLLPDLYNIQELDLSFNNMTKFPSTTELMTPSLTRLNVMGNPFSCDCDLIWMRNSRVLQNVKYIACVSPSNGTGYLAACFPASAQCSAPSVLPQIDALCRSQPMTRAMPVNMTAAKIEQTYPHCIVPPEPTTTIPTTTTTTPTTTILPVSIQVVANESGVAVEWDLNGHPRVLGYVIVYRQFATNFTKETTLLSANDSTYYISDMISGMNYVVCVEVVLPGTRLRGSHSCEEVGINLGSKPWGTTEAGQAEKKDKFPTGPIIGAGVGVLVIVAIIIFIIVWSLRRANNRFKDIAKKKDAKDQMVRDKLGMWVSSFTYSGNANELMGEQTTMEYDLFSESKEDLRKTKSKGFVPVTQTNGVVPEGIPEEGEEDEDAEEDGNESIVKSDEETLGAPEEQHGQEAELDNNGHMAEVTNYGAEYNGSVTDQSLGRDSPPPPEYRETENYQETPVEMWDTQPGLKVYEPPAEDEDVTIAVF